jgi:hypothetical protein
MAREVSGVKILNAAIEERPDGAIILRGTLSPESLRSLRADDYQREVLSKTGAGGGRPSRIRQGIEDGSALPDIELGMRGQNFTTTGKSVVLHDPVYIIDGLQRVNAMLEHMSEHDNKPNGAIPLGAAIHFDTTKEWENERFTILNKLRTPVAPAVLLRNMREQHPALLTLYGLSKADASFVLYERVCWDQRMKQQEIIAAPALVKAAMALHRHVMERTVSARGKANLTQKVTAGERGAGRSIGIIDRVAKDIGLQNFRDNVKDYFKIIDECWGIRTIEYGEAQGHLRGNFLMTLGTFLSRNEVLWDERGRRLKVDTKTLAKLRSFPINDPEIRRLCAAGAVSVIPLLYNYLLEHMNKNKPAKNRFK